MWKFQELLALEERIGNVSTGLSEETVLKCLKQKKYAVAENLQSENEPCCVCQVNERDNPLFFFLSFCAESWSFLTFLYSQEDYNEGEDIGTLECGHDFHRDCIKQWLTQKNLCPICKTTALKRWGAVKIPLFRLRCFYDLISFSKVATLFITQSICGWNLQPLLRTMTNTTGDSKSLSLYIYTQKGDEPMIHIFTY